MCVLSGVCSQVLFVNALVYNYDAPSASYAASLCVRQQCNGSRKMSIPQQQTLFYFQRLDNKACNKLLPSQKLIAKEELKHSLCHDASLPLV